MDWTKKLRTFWSLIINPNEIQQIDLLESTELKITNVCIISNSESIPKQSSSFLSTTTLPSALTQIYINNHDLNISLNVEKQLDENWKLITTLVPGRDEHRFLNFVINSNENPKFFLQNRPIGGNLGTSIHLIGYLTTYLSDDSVKLEEEDEEEEEKEEEEKKEEPAQNQSNLFGFNTFSILLNHFEDELHFQEDTNHDHDFHLDSPKQMNPFDDFEL